jgi:hypothetical protein
MARSVKLLVAGLAVGLTLSACGGSSGDPEGQAARDTTSGSPVALEGQVASAANAFQGALDDVVAKRGEAQAARADASNRYNETEGTERDLALTAIKTACSTIRTAYFDFDAALRAASFADDDRADVNAVLAETGELISILDGYQGAADGEAFKAINDKEVAATAEWERAVDALATRLGARGMPGAAPEVPAGQRAGTGEYSMVVPAGLVGHASSTLHFVNSDETVAISTGTLYDAEGNPATGDLGAAAEASCAAAAQKWEAARRDGLTDETYGPHSGKACTLDYPDGNAEKTVYLADGDKIYSFSLNAPKDAFDGVADEFRAALESLTFD